MQHGKEAANTDRLPRPLALGLVVVSVLAGGVLAVHLGEDATIDLRAYHAAVAYWVVANHLHDVEPAGYQSYFNPLLSLPTYLGLSTLSPRTFQFGLGCVQGLCGPLVYLIARRLGLSTWCGVLVGVAALLTASAIGEYGSSQGDLTLAPLVLLGVWLGLRAIGRDSAGAMALAGLALGAAAGLKGSVAPFVIGALVAIPWCIRSARRLARDLSVFVAGAIGGALITYGWWGIFLWSRYGDPFFPVLNSLFHSPYVAPGSSVGPGRSSTNPLGYLTFAFRMNVHPFLTGPASFRQLVVPATEVALVLVLVFAASRAWRARRWQTTLPPPVRYLAVLVVVTWIVWCATTATYRYVPALEMLCYPLLAALVVQLAEWAGRPSLALVATAIVVALLLLSQSPPQWGKVPFGPRYFRLLAPSKLERPGTNLIFIDDALNSFVLTQLPSSDVAVRDGLTSPVTPSMLALERASLRKSAPSYVVWGDPTEAGEPAWVVDPVLDTTLSRFGFARFAPSSCLTAAAIAPGATFSLYACAITWRSTPHSSHAREGTRTRPD